MLKKPIRKLLKRPSSGRVITPRSEKASVKALEGEVATPARKKSPPAATCQRKKKILSRKPPCRKRIAKGFETIEDAMREDRHRMKILEFSLPIDDPASWLVTRQIIWECNHRIPSLPRPYIDADAVTSLLEKLKSDVNGQKLETTLASSVSMRLIRQEVIGSSLEALGDIPDSELRTFTILNRNWVFTPEELFAVSASTLKNQLRTHLERAGVFAIPGFFIAFLHGEFEPSKGVFVLHYHGITIAEKAAALSNLKSLPGYEKTHTGAAPIMTDKVADRAYQVSYLLKSYWPQKAIRRCSDGVMRRDRQGSRIPGRFEAVCLVWLNQQSLRDISVMNDCWSPRNGGSPAMRKLYLSINGQ